LQFDVGVSGYDQVQVVVEFAAVWDQTDEFYRQVASAEYEAEGLVPPRSTDPVSDQVTLTIR